MVNLQSKWPDWYWEKQTFHIAGQGNKFSSAFIILLALDNASKKHDQVYFLRFLVLFF